MSTPGQRIKARREALGLSFKQVSDVAGISTSVIHDLESNPKRRPSAETIYDIAKALGCSMEYLLGLPHLPCETADLDNTLAKENLALKKRLQRIADAVKEID